MLGGVEYLNAFMICRIVYWSVLLSAALVGYYVSCRFPSGPTSPSGFEYFVIFSSVGPALQILFTLVATVQTNISGIFLAEEITNLLQVCTQVVSYAYAKSIRTRTDENVDVKLHHSILMGVLLHFVVCNFALWVEDSFIETWNSETSWQKEYYDNWPVIYNIFNPLSLVFRFNSALLFLNVLLDKRR